MDVHRRALHALRRRTRALLCRALWALWRQEALNQSAKAGAQEARAGGDEILHKLADS